LGFSVDGIVNIIKNIAVDFPNLGVVFDGWSRIEREDERGELMIAKDKATEQEILEILPPDIQTYSTIGSMSYEKVVWAYAIDLYVIPLSSGSTAVSWIANKPGVMHANSSFSTESAREQVTYSRENVILPVFLPVEVSSIKKLHLIFYQYPAKIMISTGELFTMKLGKSSIR
jgi:hypothetical protein